MDKRPPLGPNARLNLMIFGGLTLVKAAALVVFAAVIATALTFMARLTYFALVAPQTYETERAAQQAEFAGSGLAGVDGIWLATLGRTPSVTALLIVGVCALVLRGVADAGLQFFAQKAATEAKSTIRQQLMSRLLATGGVDTPAGTGATAVLLSRGLNALDQYYSKTLTALVSSMLLPLVLWMMIVTHDWISGLVIALTIPLIPVFMILIGKTTQKDTEKAQKELHRLSDHVVELVKGLPVLIGLGRDKAQAKALKNLGEKYQGATMFTLRSAFMSSFALELITTLSVAIIAVLIGVRLVKGEIGLDTALLALILAPECYLPLRQVGAAYHQSEDGVAALRQAQQIIDQPYPEYLETEESDRISVKNLTVTYPGRQPALSNVYFSVKHGSSVAVVGDSGIGKSTLLSVLAGTLRDGIIPTGSKEPLQVSGTVSGQGRTIFVPQNPVCIAPSAVREVLFYLLGTNQPERAAEILHESKPLAEEELQVAVDILEMVGLANIGQLNPNDLSAGQLRRLAIARALATASATQELETHLTVLVDEPTAHLDSISKQQVAQALELLSKHGATVFIVTHDPEVAASTDHLLAAHINSRLVTWTLTAQEPRKPQILTKTESLVKTKEQIAPEEPAVQPSFTQTLRTIADLTNLTGNKIILPVFLSAFTALAAISLTALSGWLIVRAAQQPAMMYLMVAIVGVRFFGIGRAAARYAERLATHKVILSAANILRLKSWLNASRTAPSIRQLLSGQGVLERVVSDVDELRDAAPRVVLPIITYALVATAALITTACVALPALPIIVMAVVLSLVLIPWVVTRADQATENVSRQQTSRMLNLGVAALDAAPELTANRLQAPVLTAFKEFDQKNTAALQRGSLAAGIGQSLVTLVWWFAALATVVVCWTPVRDGNLKAPLVAIVVLMCTAMLESNDEYVEGIRNFRAFAKLTQRVRNQFPNSLEEIDHQTQQLLANTTESTDLVQQENLTKQEETQGEILRKNFANKPLALKLQNAAARWPAMTQDVFKNLDIEASTGTWTGITGPSGAGKSTALAVLLGFLPLTHGNISANGKEISNDDLRGFAAWCPQSSYIFESTIANNLAIARTGATRPSEAEMLEVLERVGLGSFIRTLEQGLDTPVGAGGSMVSGGQRQRLAVARTLLTDSPLLLLDEPTAHLDQQAAQELMEDLAGATKKGKNTPAVIIVSHRQEDINLCENIVKLGENNK